MSEDDISVLSVRNPYARSIVHGNKPIELRTWRTDYRGRLYIHAGKRAHVNPSGMSVDGCVFGAIVGYVDLVDVQPLDRDGFAHYRDEHQCDDEMFSPKMHGWFLENPVVLDHPIPCAGKLRIFKMDGGTHDV